MTKFDKEHIPYVNKDFKLWKIGIDEEEQNFSTEIEGIKYYKSITDLLVLLKNYKTLFNVNKLPSPSEKVRKRCVEEAMLAFKNANIENE